MNSKSIIFLANQPLEAKILAKLATRITRVDPNIRISLVFTDYYTFYFQKLFLNGLTASFPGDVITQEAIHQKWQSDENLELIDHNYLNSWSETYCKFRSLDQLARTNQWIYGNENNRYLLKTSEAWKRKILFDTITWCEELILLKRPDIIFSISNVTLPTNIFFEIARVKSITFLTLSHTRLQNYWILRDDFAYGMSDSKASEIKYSYSNEHHIDLADQYINNMVAKKDSFYQSLSNNISENFINDKSSVAQSFFRDLKNFMASTYWRAFMHGRERPYKVKRVEQNLIMVSYTLLRHLVIYHLRSAGFKFSGKTEIPDEKYFFWALQARPESSGIVLGDGEDEIDKLFETAEHIPSGCFLVVKENPSMLGYRDRGFYRKIKKHKKLILIDPFVSSLDLLQSSLGVIGISGTILLEAAFYDKPSYALGKPEFNQFLSNARSDQTESFINEVLLNKSDSPRTRIKPYVAYLISESIELYLLPETENENLKNEKATFYLEKKIMSLL